MQFLMSEDFGLSGHLQRVSSLLSHRSGTMFVDFGCSAVNSTMEYMI